MNLFWIIDMTYKGRGVPTRLMTEKKLSVSWIMNRGFLSHPFSKFMSRKFESPLMNDLIEKISQVLESLFSSRTGKENRGILQIGHFTANSFSGKLSGKF